MASSSSLGGVSSLCWVWRDFLFFFLPALVLVFFVEAEVVTRGNGVVGSGGGGGSWIGIDSGTAVVSFLLLRERLLWRSPLLFPPIADPPEFNVPPPLPVPPCCSRGVVSFVPLSTISCSLPKSITKKHTIY